MHNFRYRDDVQVNLVLWTKKFFLFYIDTSRNEDEAYLVFFNNFIAVKSKKDFAR